MTAGEILRGLVAKWWPLIAAAILIALLAGCGAAPLKVPETVQVPVPVSCIEAPIPRPNFYTDAELAAMDDYKATLHLWLERRVRQAYEALIEAAMAGCWQPEKNGT